jgi:hypothetical protein
MESKAGTVIIVENDRTKYDLKKTVLDWHDSPIKQRCGKKKCMWKN